MRSSCPAAIRGTVLAQRAVQRIRAVDPQRWIMIGGNHYNSASALKDIQRIDDPHIVYTFHFYEPFPFTHQRAAWVEFLTALDAVTPYPGEVPGLAAFLEQHPQYRGELQNYLGKRMDIDLMRQFLQPAAGFPRRDWPAALLRRVWRHRPCPARAAPQLAPRFHLSAARARHWGSGVVLQGNELCPRALRRARRKRRAGQDRQRILSFPLIQPRVVKPPWVVLS